MGGCQGIGVSLALNATAMRASLMFFNGSTVPTMTEQQANQQIGGLQVQVDEMNAERRNIVVVGCATPVATVTAEQQAAAENPTIEDFNHNVLGKPSRP